MSLGYLWFAVAILFSIGLHEFGHFITAKKFGIKVEQFFIGFGPRLWSIQRGETEYGIKALPLGGFVRIAGMNPYEEIPPEDRPRVFKAAKPWQRAIVLAAGSFTHFVLAIIIIAGILAFAGLPDIDHPTPVVSTISKDSPAAKAGLARGDRILAVDGISVREWGDAVAVIKARPGENVGVRIERNGAERTVDVRLAESKPGTPGRTGFLGVGPTFPVIKRSIPDALGRAAVETGSGMKASLVAFKDLFSASSLSRLFSQVTGREERRPEDPATVIGVGRQAGSLARRGDFVGFFFFIAGFNIFIGVANLLPLPPLDGGHLAVLVYEKIARRDVDMRRLVPITATVITIFGTLFMMLLYLDIVRPLPALPG